MCRSVDSIRFMRIHHARTHSHTDTHANRTHARVCTAPPLVISNIWYENVENFEAIHMGRVVVTDWNWTIFGVDQCHFYSFSSIWKWLNSIRLKRNELADGKNSRITLDESNTSRTANSGIGQYRIILLSNYTIRCSVSASFFSCLYKWRTMACTTNVWAATE